METDTMQPGKTILETPVINSEILLDHWQGHRKLTRKMIEAFPEDKLFNYSVGGMRPFAELAMEMIRMSAPGIQGIVTGKWISWKEAEEKYKVPSTRKALLAMWDEATTEINLYWPQITAQRFQEVDSVFGQYKGPVYWSVLYFIDNEIHHRAQGYVYLRSLGVEPPPFWDRA
jgi:uncharacterized damage-inducible protein DinB